MAEEKQVQSGDLRVTFLANRDLVDDFRRVVEREERTVSHALRHHMRERVEQDERERQAA